ncbi:MAG: enoyl-CoA hydratase/isomerase family protein [Dehalococcoidia bacterium]|nr:enoyl-CoA hydratase/isomerase family protein [Dehalococcoidia bacterium]
MAVTTARHGHVLVITLQGDNDLNIGVVDEDLFLVLDEYGRDPEMRCCVITGAGERAFSAGADLRMLGAGDGSGSGGFDRPNLMNGGELWKPIVAAINGHCIGAGFMFAIACDIRIAAEHATFSVPEVRYGFPPGLGVTQRLPKHIGAGPALEFLLTGDRFTAQQALQWGLVNRVVPAAALMENALALAGRIAANPPIAVRGTKELVYRSMEMPLASGLRLAEALFEAGLKTEDAREAMSAFKEKRSPVFKGR